MWRRKVLILFICLLPWLGQAQSGRPTEKQLRDFRHGTYLYKNGYYKGGKVIRSKKWQIEEYPGLRIKFRIDWISDFEYHLTFVRISDPISQCLIGKVIKVKVLELDEENETYTVIIQNDTYFESVRLERIEDERSEGRIFSFMK